MDEELTQAAAPARTSETIGPYKLRQRLGEGGMGDVWLAEQTHPVHGADDRRIPAGVERLIARYKEAGRPKDAAEWQAKLPKEPAAAAAATTAR